MISPGEKLDGGFRLKVVTGGAVKEMAFADLLTRRTIVSVFMKNRTPTCDRQTASLAEHAAGFERAGYTVVALSRDTIGSQQRRAAALGAPLLVLASDPADLFAQATRSLVPKSMYGRTFTGPLRAAYVFERDGTLLAVAEKIDAADHAAQLKALLRDL